MVLSVLPCMLEDLRNNRGGFPYELLQEQCETLGMSSYDEYIKYASEEESSINEAASKRWDEILSEMIFLLREANEDTCTKINPYKEEYDRVWEEFTQKHGSFGEKLLADKEKSGANQIQGHPVYFPSELPEYKEVCDRYMNEEIAISKYRERCKNEAMILFSKWFYDLWD